MASVTRSAGTGANGSGGGSTNWTNPGNVTASDNNYATFFAQFDGDISKDLDCTNFGFNIPAGSTINGIEVHIERYGTDITDISINLLNGDGAGGESQDRSTAASWSSTDTVDSFGGSTDTWGETWSVSDVNSSNFGVRIQCQDNSGGFPPTVGSAQIDHVEITVHYSSAARNSISSAYVEVLGDETAPGRNSVSSLFVEVLGDETAPGRNSVSSLFVEVLGDDTADVQSISTNFGNVELKAVYFGDVQISKIRHGNTSIYN